MTSNVLPLFWPLANSSKDTRLTASASLVSSLETFQQSFVANGSNSKAADDESDDESGEEVDDDDDESGMEVDGSDDDRDVEGEKLDRQLARENAEDVVYCVKRLVRGLASSRDSSRLGFAVALTELLSRMQSVTAAQIFSLVIRNSQYSKQMKGSDERDMMFARLFGLTAIVQSHSLLSPTATREDFAKVIGALIQLGNGKAWIRESAWWTVIEALQGLLDSKVEWKDEALKEALEKVFEDKAWGQEKIAVVLLLESKVPNLDWKAYLAPTFKYTPLLNSHNLVTLGRLLKEAPAEDEEGASSSAGGSWKPQLHFVWTIILDHYFASGAVASSEAPFQDLFRVVVDESLFSNTSSAQRKYWGFQVFERALPLLSAQQMPLIFTPNFMRSWMNNLSSADRYLHKAALQIAKRVQDVIKENPKVGFTLLSQLVGKHGKPDFDKVTKTKTVESIMGSLNAEGAREYVEYLQGIIINAAQENIDTALIDERRLWALDQLLALCRNGSVPKADAWIISTLNFLLLHGFFIVRKTDKKSSIAALHSTPKPALSEATAAACRARFFSCVTELTTASISQRGADEPTKSSQQGSDVSGKLWLWRSLDTIGRLEADHKHVELSTDADAEIKTVRRTATDTLAALQESSQGDAEVRRGVEILLTFFVLQTYDEVEDALDLLEEVNSAAQKIFNLPSAVGSSSVDEDDVPAVDALLDVLIALLDKNSSDMRNLANLVFSMVSSAFTESSLKLLSAQLEQTAASAAAAEADDEDEDEDEEEDGESGSGSGSDEVEEDDEEDEESSEEGEDDDEDDLPDVDPAFRQRVADALKVAGMGVDEDQADSDDESNDDEERWDDEQMMKVDEQLAAVFRQQASTTKRTDLKHLQIESLHFKNRVLDFFDTYAKKQITNPLVLHILAALLRLVRASGSSEGELANKAAGILKSRFNKPKDVPSSALPALTKEVLVEIHDLAQKATSAEFSNLCSLASLFVVRTIDASSQSSTAVVEVYRTTLEDFMTRKSSLVRPNFILDFIRRFPLRAFALHSDLTASLAPKEGAKVYRQLQAYTMLQTLSQHLVEISKSVPWGEIEGFIRSATDAVFSTLDAAADEASSGNAQWNAQRLKDVLKFALALARQSKNLGIAWDQTKLEDVIKHMEASQRTQSMKGLQGMTRQLLAVLGAGANKKDKADKGKGKRKAVDEDVEMMDQAKRASTVGTSSKPSEGKKVEASAKAKGGAEENNVKKKVKKVKTDKSEEKVTKAKSAPLATSAEGTTVKSKKTKTKTKDV